MATSTQPITLDEYLHTSYEPDCDYVDGQVQERNLGELDHGEVQGAFVEWFRSHGKQWNIRTIPELRIRVATTRVRIADVALLSRSEPAEQVPTRPPLAVIEILSPEDRVSRYEERIDDYRGMGIRNIWVIDPKTRRGFDCSSGSWIETQSFKIENSPVSVDLAVIFAELN
jgi:Uma2 family endonuclease